MTYKQIQRYYLKHSGIPGMKWGVRNGPPYPLGESDKSSREKRLEKESKQNSIKLTDAQKKAIKRGAIVVGAIGATAIGGYLIYQNRDKINSYVNIGGKHLSKLGIFKGETNEPPTGSSSTSILNNNHEKLKAIYESKFPKLNKQYSDKELLEYVNLGKGHNNGDGNCKENAFKLFLARKFGLDSDNKDENLFKSYSQFVEDYFKYDESKFSSPPIRKLKLDKDKVELSDIEDFIKTRYKPGDAGTFGGFYKNNCLDGSEESKKKYIKIFRERLQKGLLTQEKFDIITKNRTGHALYWEYNDDGVTILNVPQNRDINGKPLFNSTEEILDLFYGRVSLEFINFYDLEPGKEFDKHFL